jgi:hypothetical protein
LFAFAHSVFQDHFAAGWLLREQNKPEPRDVLTDYRWQEALITALHLAPEDERHRILTAAEDVLREEIAQTPGLVSEVRCVVAANPQIRLPVAATNFTWPTTALRVLQILAKGLRYHADPFLVSLRDQADQFVVSAFAAGTAADQRPALDVLFCTSDDVALWATEYALASGRQPFRCSASHSLISKSSTFAKLTLRARCELLYYVKDDMALIDRALASRETLLSSGPTFPGMLRQLVRAGQIFSVGLCLVSLYLIARELNTPRPGVGNVELYVFYILVAIAYLLTWMTSRRRLPNGLAMLVAYLWLVCFDR